MTSAEFHTGFSVRGDDMSVLKQKLSRGVGACSPRNCLNFKTSETII